MAISSDVGTFFMRVVGISSITASRTSKAEFVLPVPMGSPENYYGVFGDVRGATYTHEETTTTTTTTTGNSGWRIPTAVPTAPAPGNQWTTSSGTMLASVQTNNNVYAAEATNGDKQQWGSFAPGHRPRRARRSRIPRGPTRC